MRDDSAWNRLTAEQREKLESWLFDENLGYAETLARGQAVLFGPRRRKAQEDGNGPPKNGRLTEQCSPMFAYVRLCSLNWEKIFEAPPAESSGRASLIKPHKAKEFPRKSRKCHARSGRRGGSQDSSMVPRPSSQGAERGMPRGRRAGSSGDSRGRSPSRSRRGTAVELRQVLSEELGTSPKRNTPAISP